MKINKKWILFCLLTGAFLLICLPILAQEQNSSFVEQSGTIGTSIAGGAAASQAIEFLKSLKKSQKLESQDVDPSGFSMIGHHIKLQTVEKETTKHRRQIRHLEDFLIKKFPQDFNRKDTNN